MIADVIRVVVGALVSGDRVLLVHRRTDKRARPGLWDLPGGVVEAGESELGALARELREELGVQVSTGSASHLARVTVRPAEEPALLSAWVVREWHGTPMNVAPEEHDEIAWFGLAELPPPPHVVVRTALVEAMRTQADGRQDRQGERREDSHAAQTRTQSTDMCCGSCRSRMRGSS